MKYSKQDCIESLREAKRLLGHSPKAMEYRDLDLQPSDRTILNKFGSWNNAKRAAGLKVTEHGRNDDFLDKQEWLARVKKRQPAYYYTREDGREEWMAQMPEGHNRSARVHRLAAVAWFGFDAVTDMDVHHKNHVPWDNREDNLKPMNPSEHRSKHRRGLI